MNVELKLNEPAGSIGDFGNFLNGFAKSPRLIVLDIDWVQFVLKNCEILHSAARGLYDRLHTPRFAGKIL